MNLVIRLASPVQTWSGYRVAHTDVAASPIPTKSGVAGLLGACIGLRQYLDLLDAFSLRVRVDRTNSAENDLQVAVPPRAGGDTELWHRSASLHDATHAIRAGTAPTTYRPPKSISITGGTNKVQYSPNRAFIPHAEFICHLSVDATLGDRLVQGFHRPVYTPYLGRMANPACFPFFLGVWEDDGDILAALPYVPRHDEHPWDQPRSLRVHTVTGGYTATRTDLQLVTAPRAANREAQLTWAKERLRR